ncbi:MAG: DUF2490 domain-containing protein [Saprospiraceae bacterium]|nr:DUF2490 domain-containing protein [Saprospiraceae bacterium]
MYKYIIMIALLMPFTAVSQDSDLGNWLIYIGNKKLDNQWNLHHEVQYRNYNAIGDLEQLLLRTGIGKNITDGNNNLLMGYGFIRSENYTSGEDKIVVNEHRIFQQFITRQSISKVNVQHRYRFEQRFVEEDFKMRFRYFLGLTYPLTDQFYLSSYNEIFINAEQNVFDRNRLYGGLGYKLFDSAKIELGYMNQFLTNSNRDQINLIGFVNF